MGIHSNNMVYTNGNSTDQVTDLHVRVHVHSSNNAFIPVTSSLWSTDPEVRLRETTCHIGRLLTGRVQGTNLRDIQIGNQKATNLDINAIGNNIIANFC